MGFPLTEVRWGMGIGHVLRILSNTIGVGTTLLDGHFLGNIHGFR